MSEKRQEVELQVMMLDVRQGYRGLRRIKEEIRLPWEPSWETAKVLNKLRPHVVEFEEFQREVFLAAGAVPADGGLKLEDPMREDGDSDEEFRARAQDYRAKARGVEDAIREKNKTVVTLKVAPLPIYYFKDEANVKPEKRRLFSANDLADAMPFLTEE